MAAAGALERSFMELSGSERERPRHFREFTVCSAGTAHAVAGAVKYSESAGGFYYVESGKLLSVTRNRFIHWKTSGDTLELVEESLDINLLNNAVRFKFQNCSLLPGGVHVSETQNHVIILILTNQTVHRLLLPHPSRMYRSELVVESQMQSIFTDVGKVDFSDPCNYQLIPAVPGLPPNSTTSAAWLSSDGEALFALPSAAGGIFILKLPPYDIPGMVSVVELKQSSVMQRLLVGWMPTAIRGDQGSSDRPLSLAVHCVENDAFIFALCQDHKLRMWSYKDQMCLMVANILEYVPVKKDLQLTAGTGHKLRLAYSPAMGLYLGIYIHAPKRGQFCIFQLTSAENNHYNLDHISSLFTSQETLIDFALTSTDIWALWHDAENQTVVKYINFEHNVAGQWNPVFMQPLPDEEIIIRDDQDPREMYLQSLFTPGRFINAALCKALQIFCRGTERNLDLSWSELKKEVTLAVESELQGSVTEYEFSQEQFRNLQQEFWCKFYACCLQYQEALSHPLALHLNPHTNMVCLLKKGYLSFLMPSSLVDHLYLLPDENLLTEDETTISDDVDVARDVICLIKCLRMIGESVTMDMSVMMEMSCFNLQSPEKAAEQILEDLITIDVENVMEDICSKLQEIKNPIHAIGLLIREMDYETEVEMEKGFDPAQPLNVRMNLSQLYGSSTAGYIMCRGVHKIATTRFLICRDLLILQQLLMRLGDAVILGAGQLFQAQQDLLHRTAPLLLSYRLIKWGCQCLATDVPVDTLESNLQHLSVLELTDSSASVANKFVSSPQSIVELFFQEVARKDIISHLFSQPKAPLSQTGLNWPEMITAITSYLLQLLWPSNPSCLFLECLMGSCQYVQLQDYIHLLHPWCQVNVGSCRFMLGRCYLVTGEGQKALECFCQAASEVGKEEFLDRLIRSEDGEIVSNPRLQYYDKVLRLLDVVGLPELVIQLATSAVTEAGDDWKSQATLRTCIFKHHLDLGHNSQAYEALTQIPDSSRQLDCLRQLVVVLCERSQLQDLVEFPYVNLHNEVVGIIESRARAVDLMTHNYYELLYAFHVYRHNYRKAGTVMFEYGMRLGREVRTLRGLEKQGNCYLAAINCLRLIRPEYAWIVQPASGAVYDRPGASPKRNHDGECTAAPTSRQIEILDLEDLEKECSLARVRLALAQHEPSAVAVAGSSSAEEMVTLLVQAGLFDTAISLCQTFKLPLTPVFEGLAFKCIKLQFGGEAAQAEAWAWLAVNQLSSVITTKESSATDEAWRLLSTYLERYKVQNNLYHHCVINKLLSHGVPLPNWLINSYKKVDAAELLRLYLNYDLLEEAVELVSEYVDAVLGKGHQYFGIEFPLSATAPMVWLPYSSIDQLLQVLGENSANSHNIALSQKILDKLEDYQQKVDKATRDLLYRRNL
ncbi:nuclear pore complex protein Nup160 isoform X1 [Pipistrellus kuhlii]|uniref:Nucleoporin 160 n=2 Tax=Pipistrellus kuhlii TaxID=59472 RepID=A0A7J7X0Q7_PIPKU|nr:nuclear pore complex protein Nup160 isoform X1 [Pipistrellus kuhlii]KAF6343277.1 nucleoporin 160 [Pipistrellus kuhlii]